ncbi:EAL domain-containing protein [Thiomicrorhabdus aquaedulcis]|uniref:EAL domain-containing protein n=1 Tax=Thiomicrorhabdus aquaedulcis TaxID=2211106 RepID=UPI000FD74F65|nr:EAL domain-containing protein [Thiomicrorhabdus aquaedulcis]
MSLNTLDDFGTGYSTLRYLKDLPVNTIKIDKSFVMDMLNDKASLSIIEASLGLASAFHCNVIAEGVETIEHGVLLLQLGCNQAQGYVIAKPMPATEVPNWVLQYKGFEEWKIYNI